MDLPTIYIAGFLFFLLYYSIFVSDRLYKEAKENTNFSDEMIQTGVKITIVVYSLLWFITVPFFFLSKIFKK